MLKRLERARRLEPELVVERTAKTLVRGERFGFSTGAVEREHEVAMKAFAQRVAADERLELPDHVGMTTQSQVAGDAVLEAAQPQLVQVR